MGLPEALEGMNQITARGFGDSVEAAGSGLGDSVEAAGRCIFDSPERMVFYYRKRRC